MSSSEPASAAKPPSNLEDSSPLDDPLAGFAELVMSRSASGPDSWRNRESEGTSIIPAKVPEKLTPSDLGALGREELKVLEVSESEVAEAQAWLESEAQGAKASPPVSPSWVSAIPNKDKDPMTLAIGIYEAELITLEAWRSSLDQFGEVMKAVSDKEGTADFSTVLQKHIENKLLANLAAVASPVSFLVGLMDGLVAENKRAKEARDAARLRDFIFQFQRSLTDARVKLSLKKDDYFHQVKNYQGTEADKSAFKKQLVEYLDRLEKMIEEGWLTGKHIFRLWAFEWIRNTTRADPNVSTRVSGGPTESMVIVWVDYGDKVEKARIRAPGGQKIAEQFLKDADGAGLRPYEWPVRRMIIYYGKNNSPLAYGKLTAQGTRDGRNRNVAGDREDVADIKFNRLLASRPTTKDVKGE